MSKITVALFDTLDSARDALDDLDRRGFPHETIGLVMKEPPGESSGGEVRKLSDQEAAVAKGFGAGAGIGGIAGLLIGISGFAVPGVGAVIAAGPIAAALAGISLGATTGGVFGAIRNLGVAEEKARNYEAGIRRGGVVVTIETEDAAAARVVDILEYHRAVYIHQGGAQRDGGPA